MFLEFIDKVYGRANGLVDIVTLGPDGKPSAERWFRYAEEREYIERYIGMRQNEDVFLTVSLFSEEQRTNADTEAVTHAIGIDADTCHPDNFRVPPNARVQTGDGRWHCWWFLDEVVPAADAVLVAKRMASAHESQGCDAPHTHHVSKILRVPGTTNTKHESNGLLWQVEVEYDDDAPPAYPLDTLNAAYEDIAIGALAARQEATITASDFDADAFTPDELERLHEYARVAWEEDLKGLDLMGPGNYHVNGYKLACNMFRNANVKWSPYTHKQVHEAVHAAMDGHDQSDTDRILKDAMKEVGSDSLAMPSWALELLPDMPPEPLRGAALRGLEGRLKALGLEGEYTRALKDGETSTARTVSLSRALFRDGMSAREVHSLMIRASANTHKNKRSGSSVWADVQHAADLLDEEPTSAANGASLSFLTPEERQYVAENPSFIDRYVQWVASRTDAPETFARSLAFMALSVVYSTVGYIPYNWRPTPLNLWLLMLGETTTRKSTAKALFLKLVHKFEDISGNRIDIGSDATAEGIVMKLGERDGLTSLIHVDEVQGFFRGVFTKNYAQGVLEVFTDLYDGSVRETIRATKGSGNSNRASTQFLFLGVGIESQVAEVLTKSNFESGFLGRSVWSVGKPTEEALAADAFVFSNRDIKEDPLFDDLLDEITAGFSRYSSGTKVAIAPDAQATKRLNEWAKSTKAALANDAEGHIRAAAVERMGSSVVKAAALLALHEGAPQVTLRHVWFALAQAEMWVKDMLLMLGAVSSSEFERRLTEVEQYVSLGKEGGRTDVAVRKQFARLRPQEIDEVFRALQSQGRVRKHPDDPKKWQALTV